MSNQDTAKQYRWAAEDLELDLKEQQRELRGAQAIRDSEQAQLKRLQDQRQLAILPADRARLDNSIELAQRRVDKSNSAVTQIGQQVAATQEGIKYNRGKESEALGGPPATDPVPTVAPVATQQPSPTPPNATQQAAQPPLATPVEPSPASVPPSQRGDNGDYLTDPNTGEFVAADSAQADAIRAEQNRVQTDAPPPVFRSAIEEGGEQGNLRLPPNVPPNTSAGWDPETGTWAVIDNDTGQVLRSGFGTEEQAQASAENRNLNLSGSTQEDGDAGEAEARANVPEPVPANLSAIWDPETESWGVYDNDQGVFIETGFASEEDAQRAAGDPFEAARLARESEEELPDAFGPEPVPPNYTTIWDPDSESWAIWEDPPGAIKQSGFATEEEAQRAIADIAPDVELPEAEDDGLTDEERAERDAAAAQAAAKEAAINQATRQSVYKQAGSTDWRVRLQLSPTSNYLYNEGNGQRGILDPLFNTNGVIFPYTPQIQTTYQAKYADYDLVHSNFRGVFYQSSRVDDINIRAEFTAQDTNEANYLLAVIHFFRSVTKMFYGKDDKYRGSPPPLVYLSGLGMDQFYGHPCLVRSFNYTLPNNVDYIRATNVNNYGTDLLNRRTASSPSGVAGLGATGNRILNAGLEKFFPASKPAPNTVVAQVNNTQLANYVPTKMEIDIVLIPVQTRSQVSKQFSLKGFANGNLLKGGFW